jgi:hypothetical protein
MAVARLACVALDCEDPAQLARFWADLLGGEIAYSTDDFCAVRADGMYLATVRVPDHKAPSWPDGPHPKQMHIDLAVTDLEAAVAEALRLGAVQTEHQPQPAAWRVMLGPAGHPFCLSTQMPD